MDSVGSRSHAHDRGLVGLSFRDNLVLEKEVGSMAVGIRIFQSCALASAPKHPVARLYMPPYIPRSTKSPRGGRWVLMYQVALTA